MPESTNPSDHRLRYPFFSAAPWLEQLFAAGMDRQGMGVLLRPMEGRWVNLGAGRKDVVQMLPDGNGEVAAPLDIEHDWYAGETMPIPDESVSAFFAFHFFEHLTVQEVVSVLMNCYRTLKPGGSLFTVTPWYRSEAAAQDLDHKSQWTESTWKNLLQNPYYHRTYMDGTSMEWELQFNMIMGLVERNLVLVSQLIRC